MKKKIFLIPLLAIALLSGCNTNKPSDASQEESSTLTSDSSSQSSSSKSSSSSSSSSEDPAKYYDSIDDSLTGTALLNALKKIINNSSVSVSYNWSRYEQADEDPDNKSNVLLIYSRLSMSKSQHDSGSDAYCWNREHTFPQSKMSTEQSKNDNHIIYASEKKVNKDRGNLKMGVVNSGTVVKDFNGVATTCLIGGGHFDPHNRARGIVARTTMYAAAMYGFDPTDNFESIKTMLEWHTEYEVDSFDEKRNDVVYKNQKNRNPFVDHPEYGCKIWGNTNADTKAICGIQ